MPSNAHGDLRKAPKSRVAGHIMELLMHRLLCLLCTASVWPATALAAGPHAATSVGAGMIGAATGVAPLDTNGLVPRVNLPTDMLNLVQLGSAGNGWTADQTMINKILAAHPGAELEIPNGYHWPADATGANPYLPTRSSGVQDFFRDDGAAYTGGGTGYNACTAIGDGDLTECWNAGTLNLLRHTRTGNPGAPELKIAYENSSSGFQKYGYPYFQPTSALQINAQNDKGANGSIMGQEIQLNTYDDNAFTDENVGTSVNVYKAGQGSTWQFSGQTQDNTGLPPASFASVAAELDILANGPDAPASLYDPGRSNRWFIYLAPKENPTGRWKTRTAYAAGTLVTATDQAGISSVYVATAGGTSGGAAPRWPDHGTVADGSVRWTYGEPYAVSVGAGIWLDNGESATTSYAAGLATNGRFDDAVIDLSRAVLTEADGAGRGAAIRIAANAPIDFSGDATQAGQNRHTLRYASAGKAGALVYQTPSGVAFSVADGSQAARFSGGVTAAGTVSGRALAGSVGAGIRAEGTSQATATVLTAQDNAITTCAAGAGVVLPSAVIGEQVRVLNRGAATCRIYPPRGARIEDSTPDAPATLAAGTDAIFEAFTPTQWYR